MKKSISFILAVLIFVCSSFVVSANTLGTNASEQKQLIDNINLIPISENDLPDGVIPMEFDSEEEAKLFILKIKNELDKSERHSSVEIPLINPLLRITQGTATVAQQFISAGLAVISLKINYTTSGNNNTGRITSVSPYTDFTGFTLGFGWTQSDVGYQITPSEKDVYVWGNGVLDYYILIEGGIRIYSENRSLSGMAYLVHWKHKIKNIKQENLIRLKIVL